MPRTGLQSSLLLRKASALTWAEFGGKAKVNEAECIPGADRIGLHHDVAWSDVHVTHITVQVHVKERLRHTHTHQL